MTDHIKVSVVWSTPDGDLELASTIDPHVLKAAKQSVLRLAEHKVAANVGDEVRELRARLEYEKLRQLLDFVLPDASALRRHKPEVPSDHQAEVRDETG